MRAIRRGSADAGFSLVELLIVIALIAILTLIGLPWMIGSLNRAKLVGAAKEVSTLMQVARLESIKQGVPTKVQFDSTAQAFLAYADNDRDGDFDAATDRLISRGTAFPRGVWLWGPLDTGPEEANAIAGWDSDTCPDYDEDLPFGPVFRTDGSCNCAGAFRFRDPRGNVLETRVQFPATAKIVIRKWFGGASADAEWFENGEANHKWTW